MVDKDGGYPILVIEQEDQMWFGSGKFSCQTLPLALDVVSTGFLQLPGHES